ncbi:MAG TPA: bifunctional UDP-N-acetylglucosamine diphosphorylase/glucosamine-1-phosphate N-acetyltransferase GlmU [Clostridium sp.]|jgi:bifunctional UDP-N-acetylglucosamine pyrophosphorylase/glucosamine-1-phosphate N-acetyltransferase|nr:bifunctional UDP-N-acetylglucosamine diphosphorylase/glucosamine-1-phosphate N-acetyltransferase GlmU [Clostridium sp.]
MEHLMAIILAAGEGKRMKSKKTKILHEICGKPMVEWAYQCVKNSGVDEIVLVIGRNSEEVKECMGNKVFYAKQEEQLGTGHAVIQAQEYLENKEGQVVIMYGDMPLVTSKTISLAVDYHKEKGNAATIITADFDNPAGYGRIIRNSQNDVLEIVEDRDASTEQKKIKEINSGIYCFDISALREALNKLDNKNDQGEYYLTDTIKILISKGLKVGAIKIEEKEELAGINDRTQLADAAKVLRKRILNRLMAEGVTIIDPDSTYIDSEVEIGIDTIIHPSTIIKGETKIGEECIIGPGSTIENSKVGNKVGIKNSVVIESCIDDETQIGPFAYLRPGSNIGKNVKIGDFVEIKKSSIGDGTKISHLTYVGDAEVGKKVNLGCGVVVVNYDGQRKHKTTIGDNSFVGCNVNLISPVEVKNNAYIAAGSTITDEVPENSLAIARNRQVIKENWVLKKGILKKD